MGILFGILNFGHCDLFVICILVLGILFDSAYFCKLK